MRFGGFMRVIHFTVIALCVTHLEADESSVVWKWTCESGKCEKSRYDSKSGEAAFSLEACKMFCNQYGLLWPIPTGETDLGNYLSKINLDKIAIKKTKTGKTDDLMDAAAERFKSMVSLVVPEGVTPKASRKYLDIYLVNENPDIRGFSLDMDESYTVAVSPAGNDRVNATIMGKTFYGIRHGLETLSQLIVYDDIRDYVLIARDVSITDKPVYPYRGILLDTARSYMSVNAIKKTIDAMAAVKLNTFHWHITDSQSFPFVSDKRPMLTKLGAYTPSKVYTKAAIREIVKYAHVRGVRVLPEFDAPAHVGEGWQDTNLTVCFKAEPWKSYCVEPPCGQLNPIKSELYDYLEDIYTEMAEVFDTDMFHMGGDEVNEHCWNSSKEIRDYMVDRNWSLEKHSFLNLWNDFQTKAQERAYKAFGKKLPLILWTSTLTENEQVEKYLKKDDYVIQVWTTGFDPQIRRLLEQGYKLILSNYEALYFDCGFGAWVGTGHNWCSPYIEWQKVYENSPAVIGMEYKSQMLGAEATLWSEQADSATVDNRLWPRAAAMAERLWAEPATDWKSAEYRMLHIRERLVRMGIQTEVLQPEWCYQNEGYCYSVE